MSLILEFRSFFLLFSRLSSLPVEKCPTYPQHTFLKSKPKRLPPTCVRVRMARHKTRILDTEGDTTLDISSLIDVCFLLLIYFIVTSTIVPREQDLGLGIPGKLDPGVTLPPIPPMVIRIDANGAVISGHGDAEQVLDTDMDSRDLPLLFVQLQLYKNAAVGSGDTPKVMLEVNENVRQQRTIDVLNAFAAVGISSVAFNELIRL